MKTIGLIGGMSGESTVTYYQIINETVKRERGGDCAVSVAPFSYLTRKYGDDLAVAWLDAHPDVDTPETAYNGFHFGQVSASNNETQYFSIIISTMPEKEIFVYLSKDGSNSWWANIP